MSLLEVADALSSLLPVTPNNGSNKLPFVHSSDRDFGFSISQASPTGLFTVKYISPVNVYFRFQRSKQQAEVIPFSISIDMKIVLITLKAMDRVGPLEDLLPYLWKRTRKGVHGDNKG